MILLQVLFHIWVWLAAKIYGAEGINIPLMLMPTRFIGQTLERHGARLGADVRFRAPLTIYNGAVDGQPYFHHLEVGDNCFLGRDLFIDLQDRVCLAEKVTISHRVMLLTHTDVGESPLKDTILPPSQAPISIKRGAYIGAGAVILQGVEIGEEAVVAAGALVHSSVPAHAVVGGVPSKILKQNMNNLG